MVLLSQMREILTELELPSVFASNVHLPRVPCQSHLSNEERDNEMVPRAVRRFQEFSLRLR